MTTAVRDDSGTMAALGSAASATAYVLVMLFVASIPLEYSLILPGIGSITKVIGILAFCAVVIDLPLNGRVRATPAVCGVLLAFVLWSLVSVCWSFDPQLSIGRSMTYLQLLVMSWIIWQYIQTATDLQRAMQLFVAGALIVALVTIKDFRAINLTALVITDLRVSAFGQNPNETGLMLVVALPLALQLLRSSQSRPLRLLNEAYLVLGSIAAILTASRGAFVALVVAGVMMLALMRGVRRRASATLIGLILLLVLVVGAAVFLVPENTWSRLGTIAVNVQRLDFNNRTENWQAGIALFLNQPLIGIGAGAFEGATAHLITIPRSSHSTWLGVIVETGVVGAALWFGALAYMVAALRSADKAVVRALLSSIVPMAVGMAILGWDHRKIPWLVFALCLCAGSVQRSSRSEAGAGAAGVPH